MSRRSTISVREMARRLGVSTATVSRALNNHPEVSAATRARVLELADEAGYQPRVGQRHHRAIGLVYPSAPVRPDHGNFEASLLSGIIRGVAEQRYDLTIIDVARDRMPGESFVQFFRRKSVRGVIVRTIAQTSAFASEIAAEGFPHVMVADRTADRRVNFLCGDSNEQSYRAVEHLIHLGHRRIGLVVHSVVDSDHADRVDGYRRCLRDHGLAWDDDLVMSLPASMQGGAMALDRLLVQADRPTAVYVTNPLSTVGLVHRCHERGLRVPGDLSVVGFDDSDLRLRTFPRFTAVCQDAESFGHDAARWLTRFLEGHESGAFRVHRPTSLSILESTGPALQAREGVVSGRLVEPSMAVSRLASGGVGG